MKNFLSLIIFVFITISQFNITEINAQDNSKNDLKSKIDKIKAQYKEIKSIESSLKKKSINLDSEDEESSLDIFRMKNEIKKVIQSSAGGDCGEVYEVYYFQNKAFFVLNISECFVGEKTTRTEKRYYLDNGKLIQFIEGKKTINENSEEFKQAEVGILSVLDSISEHIK